MDNTHNSDSKGEDVIDYILEDPAYQRSLAIGRRLIIHGYLPCAHVR